MAPSRKKQRLSQDGAAAISLEEAEAGFDPDRGIKVRPKAKQSRTLFVRSLPATATTDTLAEYFSQAVPLKHATVVLDPATKLCRGYGFVTFADSEDAQKAKEELNGSTFAGKKIKVETAEPRHREVVNDSVDGQRKSQPAPEALQAKQEREKQLRGGVAQNQPLPRLIVRNLPWSIKEPEQLERIFRSYGKIKSTQLPKGPNGTLRGFGFVLLRGRKNAEKAIVGINGREFDGRTLAVDWAAPKDEWEQQQQQQQQEEAETGAVVSADIKDGDAKSDDKEPEVTLDVDEGGHVAKEDFGEAGLFDNDNDEDDVQDIDEDSATSDLDDDTAQEDDSQSRTIFIRNLPFKLDEDGLYAHFRSFGPLKYARIVMDYDTGDEGRSRGTGFVCFHRREDALACVKDAPKPTPLSIKEKSAPKHSLLQDTQADPGGRYTIDGRVLQISRCVAKNEAEKLAAEGVRSRNKEDKRRLYLLREGTISPSSPLFASMSATEARIREVSAKQRQDLVKKNPSLHLSFTRLAIRNIPRHITSKDLKALARQAVVGFAEDVRCGKRQPLNKEELSRGGDAMRDAEKQRKLKGKGVVTQAKIIFESREGSKVTENSKAGRSRGYGFVQYATHRLALMGLRWLNGHLVKRPAVDDDTITIIPAEPPKRLIVEFAIENAQVVQRRRKREAKSHHRVSNANADVHGYSSRPAPWESKDSLEPKDRHRKKRSRDEYDTSEDKSREPPDRSQGRKTSASRQQIIGRKRAKRKARKTALR